MKIEMMRKGSIGIKGTIANAEHHAQGMLDIIGYMMVAAKKWGFATWRQGHNMHMFVCDDGRKFVLRPVRDHAGSYIGIKVCAHFARGKEMALTAAYINGPNYWWEFSEFMGSLAVSYDFGTATDFGTKSKE